MKSYTERTSKENKKMALLFLLLSSGLPTVVILIPVFPEEWKEFTMAMMPLIFGAISIWFMGKPLNELQEELREKREEILNDK